MTQDPQILAIKAAMTATILETTGDRGEATPSSSNRRAAHDLLRVHESPADRQAWLFSINIEHGWRFIDVG
jgi:hypothetical protein